MNHLLLVDASGVGRRNLPPGQRLLYELKFPNGKRYFGITNNMKRRRQRHKDQVRRGSAFPVHRAIRAYGLSNVTMRPLLVGPSDHIAEMERAAIRAWETQNPECGYNLLPGGEFNPMAVPEIAKLAGRKLRGRENTPALKRKKRDSWTPERRAAESARHKGKKISAEHIDAIRRWNATHRGEFGRWKK